MEEEREERWTYTGPDMIIVYIKLGLGVVRNGLGLGGEEKN